MGIWVVTILPSLRGFRPKIINQNEQMGIASPHVILKLPNHISAMLVHTKNLHKFYPLLAQLLGLTLQYG